MKHMSSVRSISHQDCVPIGHATSYTFGISWSVLQSLQLHIVDYQGPCLMPSSTMSQSYFTAVPSSCLVMLIFIDICPSSEYVTKWVAYANVMLSSHQWVQSDFFFAPLGKLSFWFSGLELSSLPVSLTMAEEANPRLANLSTSWAFEVTISNYRWTA